MADTADEYIRKLTEQFKIRDAAEGHEVKTLGDRIGYGRIMQLAEQIWGQKEGSRSGQHTVGPCAFFMVRCPCPGVEYPHQCDWCCGSGRITKRVLKAIENCK